MIEDLSFSLTVNKVHLPSVNETTIASLLENALKYIGLVLLRLIFTIAQSIESKLAFMAKVDM